jgi:hypothetical protein
MTMFQTSVMEERTGRPWGFITGIAAFATLRAVGYLLLI